MWRLGLEDALAKVAITTREYSFYNRYGQHIFTEPTGRYAGYDWPQFSIHRGDLHMVLVEAFKARCGADRLMTTIARNEKPEPPTETRSLHAFPEVSLRA